MKIVFVPNGTGTGHNMRTLALIEAIQGIEKDASITVILSSLKGTFTDLYQKKGCSVINLPEAEIDHSKSGHLSNHFNWNTYISGYINKNFINTNNILRLISLYDDIKPDIIVSDYNISACLAAAMSSIKYILVTERFDFTIFQVSNNKLCQAGFDVNQNEINNARNSLHIVFSFIVNHASLVLTDKPFIESMDRNTAVFKCIDKSKFIFTGPMIRNIDSNHTEFEINDINIPDDDPIVIASVGGTSMFLQNKKHILDNYIEAFKQSQKIIPELKMIILARSNTHTEERGLYIRDYIPNWMPLLKRAKLLISSPGWITATEISALHVQTMFILSDMKEYHEIEAYDRLHHFGFPCLLSPSPEEISRKICELVIKKTDEIDLAPHNIMSPLGTGTKTAAKAIMGIAHATINKLN